jgi:hypothetical protein
MLIDATGILHLLFGLSGLLLIQALLVKPTRPLEVQQLHRLDQVDVGLLSFRTVCAVTQLAAAGVTVAC